MSKIIKTCPIVKDKKWYKVGDKFPYNPDTDKKLLWNLMAKPNANKNINSEGKDVSKK